ncbi:MAG: sigma-70 family RNA polymerase sigma factor [Lentimicrobiaceae bacterium]|nr:sigma-70 family RNA polymerase sigma factor [Lentimicrobiaceae bacterium]MCB9022994.1 sigma-70 family RNA polymerase sigma factor [Lentimicrobiaceae bacterium]HPG33024.1 sigma-70 family RNA polymerase sigma factor [Lentimicrobium sp.]
MDEKQLLKDCLNGNVHAQKRLYEMYSRKMFGVCLRYAADPGMAEDFLQEGFIKVFSRLHSFKFQGSFEGWVRRIMINTSLEMLRKHDVLRYSQGIDSSMPLQDDATDDNEAMEIDSETLFSVFQEMPPGFRTVFNLYAIEDYSHKEIGAMLKISEGTSKSQYARARLWLQKRLAEIKL